jgi:hypothetical protein
LGGKAFEGCTSLASLDLSRATTIGSSILKGNTLIKGLDISSAASIGDGAFLGSGIKALLLPNAPATAVGGNFDTTGSFAGLIGNGTLFIVQDASGYNPFPANYAPSASYFPIIVPNITGEGTIADGEALSLALAFTPEPTAANIEYQWYKDGEAIEGAATAAYEVDEATKADEGEYTISVYGIALPVSKEVTVSNPADIDGPNVVSYRVSTDHRAAPAGVTYAAGTDDQYVILDVAYDEPLTLTSSTALLGSFTASFGDDALNPCPVANLSNSAELLEDGATLRLTLHFSFAGSSGRLIATAKDSEKILAGLTDAAGNAAAFPDISMIVSNGTQTATLSQKAGTEESPARVVKEITTPPSMTRGMVHYILLRNGVPVGALNANGATGNTHFHEYLTDNADGLTQRLAATLNVNGSIGVTFNCNVLTVKSKTNTPGEVLDVLIVGYPRDRATGADKSELQAKIALAEAADKTSLTPGVIAVIENELAVAEAMAASDYYLQSEIDAQIVRLVSALAGELELGGDQGGGQEGGGEGYVPFDASKITIDKDNERVVLDKSVLGVSVEDGQSSVSVEAGQTLSIPVASIPTLVHTGQECDGCAGYIIFRGETSCSVDASCPDGYGFCSCVGLASVEATPIIRIETIKNAEVGAPDSTKATAKIENGNLVVEGIAEGTTAVRIESFLTHPSPAKEDGDKIWDQTGAEYEVWRPWMATRVSEAYEIEIEVTGDSGGGGGTDNGYIGGPSDKDFQWDSINIFHDKANKKVYAKAMNVVYDGSSTINLTSGGSATLSFAADPTEHATYPGCGCYGVIKDPAGPIPCPVTAPDCPTQATWGFCNCTGNPGAAEPVTLRLETIGDDVVGASDGSVATAVFDPSTGKLTVTGIAAGTTHVAIEAAFFNKQLVTKPGHEYVAYRYSLPLVLTIVVGDGGGSSEPEPAKTTGDYIVGTNHKGPVNYPADPSQAATDDQYITLRIPFDRDIILNDAQALIGSLNMTIFGISLNALASETAVENGNELVMVLHIPYAPFSGRLEVSPKDSAAGIGSSLTTETSDGLPALFPGIDLYVSNGVWLLDGQYERGTATGKATVTKTVFAPATSTRGMVHMLFLVNGEPYGGSVNEYGGTFVAHYHDYLNLDGEQFAKMIADYFNAANSENYGTGEGAVNIAGYKAVAVGDKVKITADNAKAGEILDLQIIAYGVENTVQNEGNTTDAKSEDEGSGNGGGTTNIDNSTTDNSTTNIDNSVDNSVDNSTATTINDNSVDNSTTNNNTTNNSTTNTTTTTTTQAPAQAPMTAADIAAIVGETIKAMNEETALTQEEIDAQTAEAVEAAVKDALAQERAGQQAIADALTPLSDGSGKAVPVTIEQPQEGGGSGGGLPLGAAIPLAAGTGALVALIAVLAILLKKGVITFGASRP